MAVKRKKTKKGRRSGHKQSSGNSGKAMFAGDQQGVAHSHDHDHAGHDHDEHDHSHDHHNHSH